MKVHAFEGPAGCGKTFQLMEQVKNHLLSNPLGDYQQILALTFMHGSRRRLHDRLANHSQAKRKFQCLTIDSIAQRICTRWKCLADSIGIALCETNNFEQQCVNATILLRYDFVQKWISNSFPIIILDEAQDLSIERLAIIQLLQINSTILVAADEFQCLDENLKPNPCLTWLPSVCTSNFLNTPQRTNIPALLNAANDVRQGKAPSTNSPKFTIQIAASAPLAATFVKNAIAWNRGKNFALITPTFKGGFATKVISEIGSKATKHGNGPYSFNIERAEEDLVKEVLAKESCLPSYSIIEAKAFVTRLKLKPYIESLIQSWITKQQRLLGIDQIIYAELEEAILRSVVIHKQRIGSLDGRFVALGIHQAKNREFDGVIVLWPHLAAGSEDHKRRLLYNAITRAKKWCLVLVQSAELAKKAPFI